MQEAYATMAERLAEKFLYICVISGFSCDFASSCLHLPYNGGDSLSLTLSSVNLGWPAPPMQPPGKSLLR